jgi:hypothetical protein
MIWSIVGEYGIAWEWLGVKDIHQDTLRNSRFPQGLNRAVPIHPKPILAHAIIRVSFLWTSLWADFPATEPHGSTATKIAGLKNCQTACKPGSVHPSRGWTAIPLGRISRCASRDQPGRRDENIPATCRGRRRLGRSQPPLFGLAPGGVYPAAPVTKGAVRSCRTVSPLPAGPVRSREPILHGRFVFCGTFPGVAPAGG